MKSVAEVLNEAADLLEKPGAWTRNQYARAKQTPRGRVVDPRSGEAVCWCAIGAIQRVSPDDDFAARANAYQQLTRTIWCREIPVWNDAPGRTQAEVVAALRQAAEAAEGSSR